MDAMICEESILHGIYASIKKPKFLKVKIQAILVQTLISELTDMDVANSSMYDGMTSFTLKHVF